MRALGGNLGRQLFDLAIIKHQWRSYICVCERLGCISDQFPVQDRCGVRLGCQTDFRRCSVASPSAANITWAWRTFAPAPSATFALASVELPSTTMTSSCGVDPLHLIKCPRVLHATKSCGCMQVCHIINKL